MAAKKAQQVEEQGVEAVEKKSKYLVALFFPSDGGEMAIQLSTSSRSLARSAVLLARENGIRCEVTIEAAPRAVKFKGMEG